MTPAAAPAEPGALTPAWTPVDHHDEQQRLWSSEIRINVAPCGRRSGKTMLAKRKGVVVGLSNDRWPDYRVSFMAPTRDQAHDIYWDDLKALIPERFIRKIRESKLQILGVNGTTWEVLGMDKPARAEGRPLDWAFVDEFGDMKPHVWPKHVRPALGTMGRPGRAWVYGVPRGGKHYKDLVNHAKNPKVADHAYFHWTSASVLPADEIESAKATTDPLTWAIEWEASFKNIKGQAYYGFDRETQAREILRYDPQKPLIFCFDFNVDPGVAVVCQEQLYQGVDPRVAARITACIGEVYIPHDSTTPRVTERLVQLWGHHAGEVRCYGDATGGARGTAQTEGSDWDLIKKILRAKFGGRVFFDYERSNPAERTRVNAVNSRLLSADGTIRLLVCPEACPNLCDDLESVIVLEGTGGELDKRDKLWTHLTDGLGYYVYLAHPVDGDPRVVVQEV